MTVQTCSNLKYGMMPYAVNCWTFSLKYAERNSNNKAQLVAFKLAVWLWTFLLFFPKKLERQPTVESQIHIYTRLSCKISRLFTWIILLFFYFFIVPKYIIIIKFYFCISFKSICLFWRLNNGYNSNLTVVCSSFTIYLSISNTPFLNYRVVHALFSNICWVLSYV